ncbi:hypothetical protein J6T66_00220 [bacterium]|nr:hypothetical protein [bacterium]
MYEYSKNFYESEWVKNLALPNCLEAQDYVDFMASFKNMEDEVKKIEQEAEEMKNFNRKYGDADSFDIDRTSYHYSQQKKLSQLTAVRKYVELWQKST